MKHADVINAADALDTRAKRMLSRPAEFGAPDCPVCESKDSLVAARHALEVNDIAVPDCEFYLCKVCGADPVMPEQIRRNEKRIAAARAAREVSERG